MNKLYIVAAGITLTSLFSCAGKDNNDYIDKSLLTPESEKKAASQTINAENNALPNTPVIPGVNNINPGAQTAPVNIIPQNNTGAIAGNLNPAHGQPGHRCDIAVGAPLDSKPAAATAQPTTLSTQPSPVTITQQPSQQKTMPGMNPPHGEPGHRCDIAVGAPLNSKPGSSTPQPNIVTTQQPAQATTTKTLPGMNPPHGEPGHRCDIAVGAPLDSKPATPSNTETQIPAVPPLLAAPVKPDSSKS